MGAAVLPTQVSSPQAPEAALLSADSLGVLVGAAHRRVFNRAGTFPISQENTAQSAL